MPHFRNVQLHMKNTKQMTQHKNKLLCQECIKLKKFNKVSNEVKIKHHQNGKQKVLNFINS